MRTGYCPKRNIRFPNARNDLGIESHLHIFNWRGVSNLRRPDVAWHDDCITNFPMKPVAWTNNFRTDNRFDESTAHESTLRSCRSEEKRRTVWKQRSIFFCVSAIMAIWQFAHQPMALPLDRIATVADSTRVTRNHHPRALKRRHHPIPFFEEQIRSDTSGG